MNKHDFVQSPVLNKDVLVLGVPGSGYESLYNEYRLKYYKNGLKFKPRLLGDHGFRASSLLPHSWVISLSSLFWKISEPSDCPTVYFGFADNIEGVLMMPWRSVIFVQPEWEQIHRRIDSYRRSGAVQRPPNDKVLEDLRLIYDRINELYALGPFQKGTKYVMTQTLTDDIIYASLRNKGGTPMFSEDFIARANASIGELNKEETEKKGSREIVQLKKIGGYDIILHPKRDEAAASTWFDIRNEKVLLLVDGLSPSDLNPEIVTAVLKSSHKRLSVHATSGRYAEIVWDHSKDERTILSAGGQSLLIGTPEFDHSSGLWPDINFEPYG